MKIENATIADAKQILGLQKLVYISEAEIYCDYNIPPLTQTLEEIIEEFDTQLVLKATIQDITIGAVRAYVKNGSCFIGRLIVHPNYQNKGIGRKLMCEIEKRFINANRFELFTGHKSDKNIRFYENLGYNIIRTEQINETLKFVYLEKNGH
ncbi:MAG: GNAT family N-acetyltransferase [Methanolobus sp.]|nr:GNAT family N-acetyltransferase [ANME-2 cluster archaeon]MDW7733699.1 GNAT family N-acetyltransferase [Methanolobus sp.]